MVEGRTPLHRQAILGGERWKFCVRCANGGMTASALGSLPRPHYRVHPRD